MKTILLLPLLLIVLIGCKNEDKDSNSEKPQQASEIPQKIANANGFDNFEDVEKMQFTFNVKVQDSIQTKRSWNWNPKTNEIRLTQDDISRDFTKEGSLSDEEKEIDQMFINDSYWLLFPFQLVWSDAEFSKKQNATSPINGEEMNKLVVSYSNNGGYTPGDTYEVFYDEEYIIREWVYKSADGTSEMATTWENYQDYEGIKIAKSHKSADENFELFFTDIEVE